MNKNDDRDDRDERNWHDAGHDIEKRYVSLRCGCITHIKTEKQKQRQRVRDKDDGEHECVTFSMV